MEKTTILDQPLAGDDGARFVKANVASTGKRFANYLLDAIMIYILMFAYGIILYFAGIIDERGEMPGQWLLFMYLGGLLYYIVMEAAFGRTIGKFITGTKVVREDGSDPDFMQILGRTLCRLIPFEPFSFLSSEVGWHDSISKTKVINKR